MVDHSGDVSEVFLMAAFAVKIEFVKDDVFGRGDGDFSAGREHALLMSHRPAEIRWFCDG